jgi:hypothetical protein
MGGGIMKEYTDIRLNSLERDLAQTKSELCAMRRRNLLLLRGGVLMAAILALAWMFIDTGRPVQARGGASVHRETRAKRFVLVDEKGKPRAILGMNKEGPGLALPDENGKVRASIGVTGVGPVIALLDEGGNSRAVLRATTEGPGLALLHENGSGRVLTSFDNP